MAYHVGLILQQEFGYEMVDVQVHGQALRQFEYEWLPPSVSVAEMEQRITGDDLLVVNPSFSRFMFGRRLPGRKICYVQDFRTFQALDCHFDLYVSVSTVVRDFLRTIYVIDTSIIPPFIQLERLPPVVAWRKRRSGSALMYVKTGDENEIAAQYLLRSLQSLPGLTIEMRKDNGIAHGEFLRNIGAVRYLINVSLAEGFGVIPLEAMALGTCVTGLDGLAGRDYMRLGENSITYSMKNIDRIPEAMETLLCDDAAAEALAAQGMADAQHYTHARFRQSWIDALRNFLG